MAPLDSADALLRLWEENRPTDGLTRAVALAAAAEPAADHVDVAAMALGARNARLLRLRSRWSDEELEATTQCPDCTAELEFTVSPARLLAAAVGEPARPITVGSRTIRWRPVTSDDLIAAAALEDEAAAAGELVARCVLEVRDDGGRSEITAADRAAVAAAIETADPLCDLLFELHCAEWGAAVTAELELPDAVWSELDERARRLVSEVHVLASAYGWTESECLTLSPARRATYLEWIEAT